MMGNAADGIELLEDLEADDSELAKMAQGPRSSSSANEILIEAVNERASDIHIEPEEHGCGFVIASTVC